jgi:hypothetical protein
MGALSFVAEDASSAALALHECPIDLVHLARTTLGDSSIEGEMLDDRFHDHLWFQAPICLAEA